jgi:hypothetical protein
MTDREPTEVTNLDIYGHPPLEWSRARDLLVKQMPTVEQTFFLGTIGGDGRPHAAGVGPAWVDGEVYFTSGPGTRKSRNINVNPACTLSARLPGLDLVLEGDATRVTDSATLEKAVQAWHAGGWPARVEGDAITAEYSAPSAGRPPWHVYHLSVHTAFAVASEEPHGATRWRFAR